ncbi:HAD-superfamily subfamily IIA hydrolase [Umbelopsis sp. AD052]|nr:HAD-superfamily subfamily IIA hydrolase [Umbelopsis sp. AD052]
MFKPFQTSRVITGPLYRQIRLHSTTNQPKFGFALDIDGVLIKGNRVIPQAQRALRLLNGENASGKKIPFVLLTNGGGVTEEKKAAQMSRKLDMDILPSQVVLSHSPMRSLVKKYKDTPVLVVGGRETSCKDVAEQYGFQRPIQPDDIHHWEKSVWPFRRVTDDEAYEAQKRYDFSREPIEAIMMFHDSRDWGRDLQIMMDVLRSKNGMIGTQKADYSVQDTPVYFSNPDFLWSNEFPVPRYGQGAFKTALEAIYKQHTGKELKSTSFGKPHRATYEYAEKILNSLLPNNTPLQRVFAVGDNPAADIAGANAYGWTSILVRTGVFDGKGNSSEFPARLVCDNIEEAVHWALNEEGLK